MSSTGHGPADLGVLEISLAVLMMSIVGLISAWLQLSLTKTLLLASIRCITQLLLLGYLLKPVFELQLFWPVLAINMLQVLLAAREAYVRPKLVYPKMFVHILVSITFATAGSAAFVTHFVIKGSPKWEARYLIPLVGMMLGNTLTAISIALDRCLSDIYSNKAHVEALLAMGATRWEASRHVVQLAVRTGLIPTLNSMMVIGLISIPGMMTGQAMAGTPPELAARYQIVIMFVLSSNTSVALIMAIFLATDTLISRDHMILTHLMSRREGPKIDIVMACYRNLSALAQRVVRYCHGRRRSSYEPVRMA